MGKGSNGSNHERVNWPIEFPQHAPGTNLVAPREPASVVVEPLTPQSMPLSAISGFAGEHLLERFKVRSWAGKIIDSLRIIFPLTLLLILAASVAINL